MSKPTFLGLNAFFWFSPITAFMLIIVAYKCLFWGPQKHPQVLGILKSHHKN